MSEEKKNHTCWTPGCLEPADESKAWCDYCLGYAFKKKGAWAEVFNKYKETVEERPLMKLTNENIEKAIEKSRAMPAWLPMGDKKECTCQTLLNGHWDGCPMRKE